MEFEGRSIHLSPVDDPKTIVDLGCWVGVTTEAYAINYPNAQIIGVELDSHNFSLAQNRLNKYSERVKLINAAAWTYDGEVECQIWGDETNYVKHTSSHDNGFGSSYPRTVKCMTLDTITSEFDTVDFIKFDVEASEHHILRRGGDWVDKTKSIFLEIHDTCNDNVRNLVTHLGFTVVEEGFELIWAVR